MSDDGNFFRLMETARRCPVKTCRRGTRAACFRTLNLSLCDWQRLLDACPIERKGVLQGGDFLVCNHVSQTQLSIARISGGCTFGEREFVYLPQHDMLVRSDFLAWAARNWRNVLSGTQGDEPKKGVLA